MILRRKFVIYAIALMMLFSIPLLEGCNCGQVKDTPEEQAVIEEAQPEEPAQVEEFVPETPEEPTEPPPPPPPPPKPDFNISDIVDVFYAFDKSELTSDSRDTLAQNAKLLKVANVKIVIEGHCDERGTNEYNLGLGERRANAAKDYLVSLGISASRIKTISYGEEKPFAMGHDESAWKQNRRAHFGLQ